MLPLALDVIGDELSEYGDLQMKLGRGVLFAVTLLLVAPSFGGEEICVDNPGAWCDLHCRKSGEVWFCGEPASGRCCWQSETGDACGDYDCGGQCGCEEFGGF